MALQGDAGDPRDARTIVDLVRTRDLRPILPDDEAVTEIRLKVGRRRDLIEEQTRRICRLREPLSSIHPGLERDLAALLAVHPDGALIQSLPGMGAVLAAEFIACVGDIRRFPSGDALACAAGLAPVIRQSGRKAGWRRTCGGDKALKRAFCAVCRKDPLSRAFYDRKRREGKHHTQALIAPARRRVTVLWTMIQRRQTCDPLLKAA